MDKIEKDISFLRKIRFTFWSKRYFKCERKIIKYTSKIEIEKEMQKFIMKEIELLLQTS